MRHGSQNNDWGKSEFKKRTIQSGDVLQYQRLPPPCNSISADNGRRKARRPTTASLYRRFRLAS